MKFMLIFILSKILRHVVIGDCSLLLLMRYHVAHNEPFLLNWSILHSGTPNASHSEVVLVLSLDGGEFVTYLLSHRLLPILHNVNSWIHFGIPSFRKAQDSLVD